MDPTDRVVLRFFFARRGGEGAGPRVWPGGPRNTARCSGVRPLAQALHTIVVGVMIASPLDISRGVIIRLHWSQ